MRRGSKEPQITTAQVTRGDVVDTVGATGHFEAVTTVQVGTQVSGTVRALRRLPPDRSQGAGDCATRSVAFETQIEQQQANVARAQAKWSAWWRSKMPASSRPALAIFFDRSLIPKTELEAAEVNVRSRSAASIRTGGAHAGAGEPQSDAGESGLHDYPLADRRHRHLAKRRRRADRRGQHAGPDAVPARGGPDEDEGQREHRRGGCRADSSGTGRPLQGDAFPTDDFFGKVSRSGCNPPSFRTSSRTRRSSTSRTPSSS